MHNIHKEILGFLNQFKTWNCYPHSKNILRNPYCSNHSKHFILIQNHWIFLKMTLTKDYLSPLQVKFNPENRPKKIRYQSIPIIIIGLEQQMGEKWGGMKSNKTKLLVSYILSRHILKLLRTSHQGDYMRSPAGVFCQGTLHTWIWVLVYSWRMIVQCF